MPPKCPAILLSLVASAAGTLSSHPPAAPAAEPIVYTIRVADPRTHVAEVEAVIPADGRASIEVMMAIWSPGFYRIQDYAGRVRDLAAHAPGGVTLGVEKTANNRWRIQSAGARNIVLSYQLLCEDRFVTTNWVGPDYAVFNGPATYITPVERRPRPQEVRLVLPPAWKGLATSLEEVPVGGPGRYRAPNFDVLADSPIVAGDLSIHRFVVAGVEHLLVDFGELGAWNGAEAASRLQRIADAHHSLFGFLPFKKYVFLNAFRRGAGGLEHLNSTLLTTSPATQAAPTLRWLKFASHEYFHSINVKRLRPIELGPFNYERPPRTPSLWISEGLTSYYGDLAVTRSGIGTPEDFLAGMSANIGQLQGSPGRLVQTLEQSSLGVWENSNSGIGGDAKTTVSYYVKGCVVGFLLDAKIRRLTGGSRSLDDVMRTAYGRYSGKRGFKPGEFQQVASEVARDNLSRFFKRAVSSTEELDYSEMLEWFGLRFVPQEGPRIEPDAWKLEVRPDASEAQRSHFHALTAEAHSSNESPAPRLDPDS